jgi:cation:H+ antiporter
VIADLLLLFLGMTLLVLGGKALVEGASALAALLGISELAIGLTVVAFGTSAPELAVNGLAALRGDTAIAFGNIIGSNTANIGLVLGVSSMVRPLTIDSSILTREIPMMLLATAAALVLGLDRMRGELEFYDLTDGIVLLMLFSVFIYYSVAEIASKRRFDPVAHDAVKSAHRDRLGRTGWAALSLVAGLVMLVFGAHLTVTNAVVLAEKMGVPDVVVGLTVVALGTSLPELVTSVVAAFKGFTNLAVGNVVGSNIFNLLFILGTTSVIQPVEVPAIGGLGDLAAMSAFAVVLLGARVTAPRIARPAGFVLLLTYLAYMTWRVIG